MTDKLVRLTFVVTFDLVLYPIVVGALYAWLKSVHTPLRLYQRRMLTFVVIWFAGICISVPISVALALWVFPLKSATMGCAFLMIAWTLGTIGVVKRMCSPGGRLSDESQ